MADISKNSRSGDRGGRAKSPWITEGMAPCDPEIFREAVDAWGAAQQVPLRTAPPKGPGYALADIALNRAAMGTVKFLRERCVPHPQAYLIRLIHMGEVFENSANGGALAKFVRPAQEAGQVLVSDALLRAVALAPIPALAGNATATTVLDIEAIRALAEAAWVGDEEATGGH